MDGNRDGNFGDGSVFYENADPTPGATSYFYQVDLGQNDYINRVQFLPRTDAYQNRLWQLQYFDLSGRRHRSTRPPPLRFPRTITAAISASAFATAAPGKAAPGGANGRFVQITRLDNNYWLTFAEMEVIGASTPLQNTLSNDIALGKPVTLDPGDSPGFGATTGLRQRRRHQW